MDFSDNQFSRRAFLKTSLAVGLGAAILPHARVMGANGDIRVAIAGVGNKGSQHVGQFKKVPGVRVVALCDPDPGRMKAAIKKHFEGEAEPRTYQDIRQLIDDKEVDAICVATPNHWHALATVWACQAGKDVYTEKPFSHSFEEGQRLIRAGQKYNRVITVGTQSRSDEGLASLRQYIEEGNLGDLEYVRGIYYSIRQPIGKVSGPQQPPEGTDFNVWLGPAPDEPLMREKLHYDWHWQWQYGNGDLGNNMVHMIDIANWMVNNTKFPEKVISLGGRFNWDDDGVTPNTQTVIYDFGQGQVPYLCEVRNLPYEAGSERTDNIKGTRVGVQVKGSDGYFVGYNAGGWVYDNDGKRVKQFPGDGGGSHHQNFINAVRDRKPDMVNATPQMGHLSAGICHLGNISQKLAQDANAQEIYEAIGDKKIYDERIDSFQEHLLLNKVDLQAVPRQLGPWLEFDPSGQKFVGERAEEANAQMTSTYRSGFEMPQDV